jgi:hypothetical protein
LKTDGRNTLENFTTLLEKKIKFLRDKHVRERKSAWRFMAEIQRHKATSIINVNQRRARVSPEVRTARDSNETLDYLWKSPVSADFRKQRSRQVHPIESSSENSFNKRTELQDLTK